jgi:hypothetical protein
MYARYRDMVGGVDCALCLERAAGHAWRVYDGDPDRRR